jgi:hypothetical protein
VRSDERAHVQIEAQKSRPLRDCGKMDGQQVCTKSRGSAPAALRPMMQRRHCAMQVGRMLMDIVDKSRRDKCVRSQLCEHNLLPHATRLPTRQPTGSDFAVACWQTVLWLQMPSWSALRGVQRCLLMQRLHSICAPCWEVIPLARFEE